MAELRPVLFELGTEELPPRFLATLRESLAERTVAELESAGLPFGPAVAAYASSRRLALRIPAVAARTAGSTETRKGPAVGRAFDAQGEPTPALLGFARKCGAGEEQIERWKAGEDRLREGQGEWVRFERQEPSRDCRELLPGVFSRALEGMPLPKRMRWGAGETSFLRPVRWAVLLYGGEAVSGEIMGIPCGVVSRGHRFLCKEPVKIQDADSYEETLETGGQVLVGASARRGRALKQIEKFEAELEVRAMRPEALLDEACDGAEFPEVIAGCFDEGFLELPGEVVCAVLEDQQYFATRKPDGEPSRHFFAIANLPDVQGNIRSGCERVVRSRLQDAAFYLERDRQRPFESRVEDLGRVVFHRKLGTLLERTRRIERLAGCVAREVGADEKIVQRAARLCKADLGTDIVQSFPKLQGVMGAHYARLDGEDGEVCAAVAEHYRPRQADDALPKTLPGQVLALADRLDMLAGVFAIGEVPTGARDPLGVRRAAYGVLRLAVECELDLDLRACLEQARAGYPASVQGEGDSRAVLDYLTDRMRGYGVERGQSRDTIEAALAVGSSRLLDAFRRMREVEKFRARPQAGALIETHKRLRNILREAGAVEEAIDRELLAEPAERELADRLAALRAGVLEDCAKGRYAQALDALAGLAEPVSVFFDAVLVMAEDQKIRHNRLRLLAGLRDLFLKIADFSRLQG